MLIINWTGVLPNGHVQLRRGRQRHQGVRRPASQPQSCLCRAPPAFCRLHLHPGQQPLRPRWVEDLFWISLFPISLFGGAIVRLGGSLRITRIVNLTFFSLPRQAQRFSEGLRGSLRIENCQQSIFSATQYVVKSTIVSQHSYVFLAQYSFILTNPVHKDFWVPQLLI